MSAMVLRFFAKAVAVLCAVLAIGVAFGTYRNARIDRSFQAIQVGSSEQDAIRKLGKPSWVEPCGKSFGTPRPNCTEYIYRDSFAPYLPAYWSLLIDPNGHVIDKAEYSSP